MSQYQLVSFLDNLLGDGRNIETDSSSFIAIGLLIMMYPILCKVKYETLHLAFKEKKLWVQIGFSIVMNWIVAPFLMVSWNFCVRCEQETHDLYSLLLLGRSCQTKASSVKASFLLDLLDVSPWFVTTQPLRPNFS